MCQDQRLLGLWIIVAFTFAGRCTAMATSPLPPNDPFFWTFAGRCPGVEISVVSPEDASLRAISGRQMSCTSAVFAGDNKAPKLKGVTFSVVDVANALAFWGTKFSKGTNKIVFEINTILISIPFGGPLSGNPAVQGSCVLDGVQPSLIKNISCDVTATEGRTEFKARLDFKVTKIVGMIGELK